MLSRGFPRIRACQKDTYERIEFASDNPCTRSPRRGEEKDVDTDKGDEGLLSGDVGGRSTNTNNGDNVLADTHSGGADQEELAATEIVDSPHTREGGNDIDDIGDNTHHERVGDTGLSEESRSVVENELKIRKFGRGTHVDSGQLLPGLEKNSGQYAETIVSGSITEAVDV